MITRTLRGGDIKVFVNGELFKPVTAFTYTLQSGHHSISGIDTNTPFEIAPGPTKIQGSFELLRARNDGGLEGRGVAAPHGKILLEKYFSLAIIDRLTDTVILYVEDCVILEQRWSIPTRGIVTGSATFEGIGWANEVDAL